MALNQPTLARLVRGINDETLVPLSEEGLIFSQVGINDPEDLTDVRLRLTAKEDYVYRGQEVVTYRRLDLSELTDRFPRPPQLIRYATTHEMLDELHRYAGLYFAPEEVEDLTVSGTDEVFFVTIKALPTCRSWVGEVQLECHQLPDINQVVQTTTLLW